MYFFEEPPYKRISNQIVEVRCFSGAAIGDIYFYFDSIVKGKIAALILHRGNIANETSSQVHRKIKSGGGLYQRQQTRLSCYTVLIK